MGASSGLREGRQLELDGPKLFRAESCTRTRARIPLTRAFSDAADSPILPTAADYMRMMHPVAPRLDDGCDGTFLGV